MIPDQDKMDLILKAAIAAPSADNSQPWYFKINEDNLALFIDEKRSGSISDTRYVLSDLALGAVIENISIQASALGFGTKITLLPDEKANPLSVAQISFSHSEKKDFSLADAIYKRYTERRIKLKGPMPEVLKEKLLLQSRGFPDIKLYWLDNKQQYHTALKALQKAESLRFRNQYLHEELFSSICFQTGLNGICKEGLSPRFLAVEPPLWPVFKLLRHWPVMRMLNFIGMANILGFRSAVLPARLSAGIAVLAVKSNERKTILQAGRALERIWLQATSDGLCVQPFAAAGVLSLGYIELETAYQHQLGEINTLMKTLDEQSKGLIFIRMGYYSGSSQLPNGRRRPSTQFRH